MPSGLCTDHDGDIKTMPRLLTIPIIQEEDGQIVIEAAINGGGQAVWEREVTVHASMSCA